MSPRARLRLATLVVVILAAGAWYGCEAAAGSSKGKKGKMSTIDIVPGKSIGNVRLGARTGELPKGATVSGPAGELDGVHFIAPAGVIEDVWIENIRNFPHELRFAGKVVNRAAPLEDLKKVFGPCDPVSGIKGGSFFNCRSGITIGSDGDEAGEFIQLRLKPR